MPGDDQRAKTDLTGSGAWHAHTTVIRPRTDRRIVCDLQAVSSGSLECIQELGVEYVIGPEEQRRPPRQRVIEVHSPLRSQVRSDGRRIVEFRLRQRNTRYPHKVRLVDAAGIMVVAHDCAEAQLTIDQ